MTLIAIISCAVANAANLKTFHKFNQTLLVLVVISETAFIDKVRFILELI